MLQACEVCKIADDEKAIQCLNNMPRRDLASHPQVQDYLKNPVYDCFYVQSSMSIERTLSGIEQQQG